MPDPDSEFESNPVPLDSVTDPASAPTSVNSSLAADAMWPDSTEQDPLPASIAITYTPLSAMAAFQGAVGLGIAFAVAGVLCSLKAHSGSLLPHILTLGDYIDFQELRDHIPVPQLLNWNLFQIQLMLSISDMSIVTSVIAGAVLLGLVILGCVYTVNPSFKLFEINHKEGGTLTFNSAHFRKMLIAVFIVGIPLSLLWKATGFLGLHSESLSDFGDPVNSVIWALRLLAIGIANFWAFHPSGLCGNFNQPSINFPGHHVNRTLILGAIFGIGMFGILRIAFPEPLDYLLTLYQTMGTFHRGYSSSISRYFLSSIALIAFGSGVLYYLLGKVAIGSVTRSCLALLAIITTIISSRQQIPFTADQLALQHDMTPNVLKSVRAPYTQKRPGSGVPDGPQAGADLAVKAGIPLGTLDPAKSRSIVLFLQNTAVTVRQPAITEDGLTTDPSTGSKVKAFLENRKYETALSWSAIKHLYNLGTVQFDNTTSLEALLLDLEHCPHAAQCSNTARSMFFTCSASPKNLALLDEYASSKNFAILDRESAKMLGDLYVRFGAVEKAIKWYRQADMPKSFMARIRNEKSMFNKGTVIGKLIWNGQPLSGVQVGVVPIRMNGLPVDLEPVLLHSFEELVPRYPFEPFFLPYNPRPFAFRWVTAGCTTDSNGKFELNSLTQGQYILLYTLPIGTHLAVPVEPRLHIEHIPGGFDLDYNHPFIDAGDIKMTYQP